MAQTIWLLKVLAGSHAGAELELSEAEYLLGSDEHCDLVFSGKDLAARHLQIQLRDEEVCIKRLEMESSVSVDGKEVKTDELVLHAFQVLAIGSLRFALAPVGEAWPELDKKPVVDSDPQKAPQPEDESITEDEAKPDQSPEPDDPPHHPNRPMARAGLSRHWLRLAVVAALLTVSGSVLHKHWSSWMPFFKHNELENTEVANPVEELKKIITRMNFDLQVGINPDGGLRVFGYVENDKERKFFLDQVKELNDGRIAVEIKTFASIKRATRRVLSSFVTAQDQIEITAGNKLDQVILSGYVVDEDRWRQAISAIRNDVPDIEAIDNQVETLDKRMQFLRAMLSDYNFEQILFPKAADGRIILEGHMPGDRLSDWENLNSRFDELYHGMPKLVLSAQLGDDGDWLSYFQVDAVSFGRVPYFTLKGQKYIVGSRLENGYVVRRINKNSIQFQSGDHHYTFYFGDAKDENQNQ